MRRWTIKELREWSDERIVCAILSERINPLNPFAPLAERLREIRDRMEAKMRGTKA